MERVGGYRAGSLLHPPSLLPLFPSCPSLPFSRLSFPVATPSLSSMPVSDPRASCYSTSGRGCPCGRARGPFSSCRCPPHPPNWAPERLCMAPRADMAPVCRRDASLLWVTSTGQGPSGRAGAQLPDSPWDQLGPDASLLRPWRAGPTALPEPPLSPKVGITGQTVSPRLREKKWF